MRVLIRTFILGLLLAMAACATDSASQAPITPAPGQGSVTVTRSGSLLYAGAPARVDLNGIHITDLGVGQTYTAAVMPGPAMMTVSAWSAPGQSSYRFTVEAGKSYRFAVAPRGEQMVVGLAGGILGQAAEGGGPFQVTPVK